MMGAVADGLKVDQWRSLASPVDLRKASVRPQALCYCAAYMGHLVNCAVWPPQSTALSVAVRCREQARECGVFAFQADNAERQVRRAGVTLSHGAGAGLPVPKVSNVTGWLQQGCHANMTGSQLYAKQDLFSIYVHRSPGEPGSPQDSIFYGRDIDDRCALATCWFRST